MRVLVIGASGTIGSVLLESLERMNVECYGSSRSNTDNNIHLDFSGVYELIRLLDNFRFDRVVNAISSGVVPGSSNWTEMNQANILNAEIIAKAVLNLNHECRLIHLSSALEPSSGVLAESDYALTKSRGTQAVRDVFYEIPSRCSIVSLHNVYSSSPLPGRFITRLFEAASKKENFEIKYPKRVRDFCILDEVVSNLVEVVLAHEDLPSEIEIGTTEGVALDQLARTIYDLMNVEREKLKMAADETFDVNPYVVAGKGPKFTLVCRTKIEEGLAKVKASFL